MPTLTRLPCWDGCLTFNIFSFFFHVLTIAFKTPHAANLIHQVNVAHKQESNFLLDNKIKAH